jgi:hypothetical protein
VYIFDRRHSDRFAINGGKVHFESMSGDFVSAHLIDLTHSSVRFEIKEAMIIGDGIEVEIDIPGFHIVSVKGRVVWTSDILLDKPAFAVVQFLPFGTDLRYNSMKTRDQVRTIIDKFCHRIKPSTPD